VKEAFVMRKERRLLECDVTDETAKPLIVADENFSPHATPIVHAAQIDLLEELDASV
jgi:hypothetical protein